MKGNCQVCGKFVPTSRAFDITSMRTKHRAIVHACTPCADALEIVISKGKQIHSTYGLDLVDPTDYDKVEERVAALPLTAPLPDPPKPL